MKFVYYLHKTSALISTISKLTELWLWSQKIGINDPKPQWKQRVNRKSFINCTGTGHCPSTGHSYIKRTHYEWNNSKEERFPRELPRTPLCVWMRCCASSQVIYSKGDSHTIMTDASLLWNFQYREFKIMPEWLDSIHPPSQNVYKKNKCRWFIVHYASLTCNSTRPQHTLQSTYNQF